MATPGEAGTGGGGGGGRRGDGSAPGGAGGTGAVVIRYTVDLETVEVDFTADRTTGFLPLSVQFTAAVDRPSGAPMALTWDFGDGSAPVEAAEASVARVYTQVGTFSVSVTAVANGQSRQKAVADLVNVVSPFVYVNVDSAAPAKPYATRETAAATLEEAMAAVTFPGQAIRIMPGTYPLERPVELKDAVAVEGDGATPADVVIVQSLENKWYGDMADRRRNLFTLDHPKARVSNLTMKNGWHRMVDQGHSAGGVVIGASGGVVSNCIIAGCVNSRANHGAAGADLAAGLITHTLVENCEIDTPQTASTAASGGAAALRLTGCARAENCLVRNCNKGGETGQFHAVLVDGEEARAVNLTIVSCGSVPYAYQNSGDATAPSYGLCVTRGLSVNCAVADVRERDGAAANRAWGGVAENFVNCATDTDERINDTSATVTAAFFRAFAAGDFRPKAGGALVNAGSDIAGFSPGSVDFAGNPRVQGRSIDIGCLEGVPCGMLIIIK